MHNALFVQMLHTTAQLMKNVEDFVLLVRLLLCFSGQNVFVQITALGVFQHHVQHPFDVLSGTAPCCVVKMTQAPDDVGVVELLQQFQLSGDGFGTAQFGRSAFFQDNVRCMGQKRECRFGFDSSLCRATRTTRWATVVVLGFPHRSCL